MVHYQKQDISVAYMKSGGRCMTCPENVTWSYLTTTHPNLSVCLVCYAISGIVWILYIKRPDYITSFNTLKLFFDQQYSIKMLACAGNYSYDFHSELMESEAPLSPLPYEVSSVSNDIRDFCSDNGEVKRVGNYFIGKAELGQGQFAKVKKGIHALTGEQVRMYKASRSRRGYESTIIPQLNVYFLCPSTGGHQSY